MYLDRKCTRTIACDVRFCRFCMASIVLQGSRLFPTADGPDRKIRFLFFFPFPFLIDWAKRLGEVRGVSMELNGIPMSKSDTPLSILVGGKL